MPIHGIGTIGHPTEACWVTEYNVAISLDGDAWTLLDDKETNQPRVRFHYVN